MKKHWQAAVCLCGVILAGAVSAQEGESAFPKLTGGGDFRLRQETFDHIPIIVDPPGETRNGLNNYMRFRTRLWGRYDLNEHVGVYARVANEFRHYYDPENTSWDFPDEVLVDGLYLDLVKLLADESLSFRLGRQDLFYAPGRPFGTGRLILEGTPKDGSRTIYFDAARATWAKGAVTIDFIGIDNNSDSQLHINDQDRDITGYTSADNKMDESGAVLYGTLKASEHLWLETYYMYKHETDWVNGATEVGRLDVHTVGGRVASKYNDYLSSNLELAGQTGDREGDDVSGYMLDALLKAEFMKAAAVKPWSSVGVLVYSGDDPDTSNNESWNPLWGRYPQVGSADLLAYSFDADGAARWNNLTFVNASVGCVPHKDAKLSAMVGQVMAPESNGPGDGHQRGLYAGAYYETVLCKGKLNPRDMVKGHLVVEMLEPGDYYNSDQDTAYFARWEIAYSF
jgi:hypothetical protein